jgi:hypothetical protein
VKIAEIRKKICKVLESNKDNEDMENIIKSIDEKITSDSLPNFLLKFWRNE